MLTACVKRRNKKMTARSHSQNRCRDRLRGGLSHYSQIAAPCQEPSRPPTLDTTDRQIMSGWCLQYRRKAQILKAGSGWKSAVVKDGAFFPQLFVLIRVCIRWRHWIERPVPTLISSTFPYFFLLSFWMKQTFCVCDLEGEKLHLTSQIRRKEVVKPFWGKTCPWTGCVNDWTEEQEKNDVAPPLSVLAPLFFYRDHEWHLSVFSSAKAEH